jgi:glycosyltransferase involved in cell wall biosynthesis
VTEPILSIVVPTYNEGDAINTCLDGLLESVQSPCEVFVVFDSPDDTTAAPAAAYQTRDPRVIPTLNTYGRGPANAIRFGLDAATAPVAVVTMADLSDDPTQIDELAKLVNDGAAIGVASRYMKGGRQVGGPAFKSLLSRIAGLTLYYFARVGTRDATNSFKAYSTDFVRRVGIESDAGFEIGIELVAKARRARLPVKEIPTVWNDRAEGESNFKLMKWLPKYLRWYFYAFGPPRRSTAQ